MAKGGEVFPPADDGTPRESVERKGTFSGFLRYVLKGGLSARDAAEHTEGAAGTAARDQHSAIIRDSFKKK